MYKKVIFASVLIAFICVQLGLALQCHHCDSPSNCKSPSSLTCTRENANITRDNLNKYFINVSNVTNDNFECLNMNYTQNLQVVMEVRGCTYIDVQSCGLQLNASVGASWVRANCTTCAGNLCNRTSPAGTFSSSVFTMFASALIVLFVKMLN